MATPEGRKGVVKMLNPTGPKSIQAENGEHLGAQNGKLVRGESGKPVRSRNGEMLNTTTMELGPNGKW